MRRTFGAPARALALIALAVGAPVGAPGRPVGGALPAEPLILVSGPLPRRAVELLGPNPLPAFAGRYESSRGRVDIWYLPAAIERPAGWGASECFGLELAVHPEGAGYLFRDAAADYALLVAARGYNGCQVVTAFLTEFSFFRTVRSGDAAPLFPALLNLP